MRPYAIGGLALLLFIGLSPGFAAAQQPQTPPTPPPQTQPTQPPATEPTPAPAPMPAAQEEPAATPSCGDCHDQAKPFVANPHARGEVKNGVVPNSVCETCHGDGTAHMEAGGDKDKIVVPRGFKGSDETCMMCHDATTDQKSRHASVHANSEAVNCLSCHTVHSNTPRLIGRPEVQVCATCHATKAAGFNNKPFGHQMGRGGLVCSTCHEPHGRANDKRFPLLRQTPAGEMVCMSCHSDKRGPYVFPHAATQVEDQCMNCHEVHGSSNPMNLRRANVWQTCIECHSPITGTTLGSQPPAFHNLSNPRFQNCTVCHVAVHGSNRNPQLLK